MRDSFPQCSYLVPLVASDGELALPVLVRGIALDQRLENLLLAPEGPFCGAAALEGEFGAAEMEEGVGELEAPHGVVGILGAASSPWTEPALEVSASLLAGNGVLFASASPLAAERLRRTLVRAGIPEELLAVVHGEEAREALPDACARVVSLSGPDAKGAMLVLEGAPVETVASAALWAAFAAGGRHPAAVGRLVCVPSVAEPLLRRVDCRPASGRLRAGSLSGGNQQKVVLAKWQLGPVRCLVLDEPTRGMDVGAKEEVMRLVADLRREGAAVVLTSSEPELVLAHADRILVMKRGQVAREFRNETVDKAMLMRHA